MLFILILSAWLAVATLVVLLCKMAARGDEALAPTVAVASRPHRGLTLFEDEPTLATRIARPASEHRLDGASVTTRSGVGRREPRARRSDCVAGS